MRVPELDAVWRYLEPRPKLNDVAIIAKGLDHQGKTRAPDVWTVHDPIRHGETQGFSNVNGSLPIFGTPKVVGINLDRNAVLSYRAGNPPGVPQVLLNYAPVSRDPWRLKATLDENGLALTSRFSAVRSRGNRVTALYLWALLNSPVANAFAYCHLGKRDILVGTIRRMPVPHWSADHATRIEQAALYYRERASSLGPLFDLPSSTDSIKLALLSMDAAVLRAYDLPPRLERQLLDLFTGVERKGVGSDFRGYYPRGFTSYLPLHLLISEDFEQAAADRVSERFAASSSSHVRQVLAAAATEMDSE
jgi:hypothetical protein